MSNYHSVITMDDGGTPIYAVIITHTASDFEIIAKFFKLEIACKYANFLNGANAAPSEPEPEPEPKAAWVDPPEKRKRNGAGRPWTLTANQAAILELMCRKMDKNNCVALGNGAISRETNVNIATVFTSLRTLVEKGIVEVVEQGGPHRGGNARPSVLKLLRPDLVAAAV